MFLLSSLSEQCHERSYAQFATASVDLELERDEYRSLQDEIDSALVKQTEAYPFDCLV